MITGHFEDVVRVGANALSHGVFTATSRGRSYQSVRVTAEKTEAQRGAGRGPSWDTADQTHPRQRSPEHDLHHPPHRHLSIRQTWGQGGALVAFLFMSLVCKVEITIPASCCED